MAISAQDISSVRARTGAGFLDVKNALDEAKGDTEAAIEILRKRGQAQAVKKADRAQGEGAYFVASDAKKSVVVTLRCETDFVARSEPFLKLGNELAAVFLAKGKSGLDSLAKDRVPAAVLELGENISLGDTQEVAAPTIGTYVHSNRKIAVIVGLDGGTKEQATDAAMHAAAMNPTFVSPEDVPADAINKEREIWKEQMKDEKKPAPILEKIMLGKEKKFREESALLTQVFVKDQTMTVGKMLGAAKVTSYVRLSLA